MCQDEDGDLPVNDECASFSETPSSSTLSPLYSEDPSSGEETLSFGVASSSDDSADDHDPEPVADEERLLSESVCGTAPTCTWVRASAAQYPNWGSTDFVDGSDQLYFWSSDEEGPAQPGAVSSDILFEVLCRSMEQL